MLKIEKNPPCLRFKSKGCIVGVHSNLIKVVHFEIEILWYIYVQKTQAYNPKLKEKPSRFRQTHTHFDENTSTLQAWSSNYVSQAFFNIFAKVRKKPLFFPFEALFCPKTHSGGSFY